VRAPQAPDLLHDDVTPASITAIAQLIAHVDVLLGADEPDAITGSTAATSSLATSSSSATATPASASASENDGDLVRAAVATISADAHSMLQASQTATSSDSTATTPRALVRWPSSTALPALASNDELTQRLQTQVSTRVHTRALGVERRARCRRW
jgi:hypothetical protein